MKGWKLPLGAAPLDALPVLTKATLMDNFDQISTDPAVHLADLEAYLDTLHGNARFAGRYWVSATSGSSGRKSIIPSDAREWAMIIASYARANEWADVLVAYASMIRALADEQVAGRLRIAPRAVNSSSEVLTAEARSLAPGAWRVSPFDVYAATETGGIAAECARHRGMHLFEDLVIPEVVDDAYRPVPPGRPGDRLLVTVLSSRTIPLIRYEMTDRVTLATEPCPDGLPFRLLKSIEGRTDDVLVLPAAQGGSVRVHPVVFHRVLDLLDVAGWQVRQGEHDLTVLVAAPGPGFDRGRTEASVRVALAAVGAKVPVTVRIVDAIPAGAAGKRPHVLAYQAALAPT